VLKALEEARNNKLIGTGLEAQVHHRIRSAALASEAPRRRTALPLHRLRRQVTEGSGNGAGGVHVEVKQSRWPEMRALLELFDSRGRGQEYPTVCERCSAVLKEIGG
jgi:hypothetical protein